MILYTVRIICFACLTAQILESPNPEKECILSDFIEKSAPEKYCLSQTQIQKLLSKEFPERKETESMMSVSHSVSMGAKAVGMLKGAK